jgi:hypothetical protein
MNASVVGTRLEKLGEANSINTLILRLGSCHSGLELVERSKSAIYAELTASVYRNCWENFPLHFNASLRLQSPSTWPLAMKFTSNRIETREIKGLFGRA